MSCNTEESLSKELLSARMLPTLLLIVVPLVTGILLPYFFPFLESFFNKDQSRSLSPVYSYATLFLAAAPGLLIQLIYGHHYGLFNIDGFILAVFRFFHFTSFLESKDNLKNYLEKRGYGTGINEYDCIIKILYIQIIIVIALTTLFYTLPESLKIGYLKPLLGDRFYFIELILVSTLYSTYISLVGDYARRDFRFRFAKFCMDTVEEKKDEVNKIYYLIKGLNSYNNYIERNLKLQFHEAMVYSKILSSSDKNQSINLLITSFRKNDKLKPISCLSTIVKLPATEQFLVKKNLKSQTKDVITILAAIIPVIISIVQLSFPQYFQNLAK
jgi:hypothetical protein